MPGAGGKAPAAGQENRPKRLGKRDIDGLIIIAGHIVPQRLDPRQKGPTRTAFHREKRQRGQRLAATCGVDPVGGGIVSEPLRHFEIDQMRRTGVWAQLVQGTDATERRW